MNFEGLRDPKPPDKKIMVNEMGDACAVDMGGSSFVEDGQVLGTLVPDPSSLSL